MRQLDVVDGLLSRMVYIMDIDSGSKVESPRAYLDSNGGDVEVRLSPFHCAFSFNIIIIKVINDHTMLFFSSYSTVCPEWGRLPPAICTHLYLSFFFSTPVQILLNLHSTLPLKSRSSSPFPFRSLSICFLHQSFGSQSLHIQTTLIDSSQTS